MRAMRQVPRKRTKAVFVKTRPRPNMATQRSGDSSPQTIDTQRQNDIIEVTINSTDQDVAVPGHPGVPPLFTELPPIQDTLITETSTSQDGTVQDCLPFLAGARPDKTEFDFTPAGVPRLERDDHIDFLIENLQDAKYIPYDAARPWLVYWCLTGLSLLGKDVTQYRQRFAFVFGWMLEH